MASSGDNGALALGVVILAVCACVSHMCSDNEKKDKAFALTDSIENSLYKRDSIIIAACDTLDYIFTKDRAQLYEEDFDMEEETPKDVGEKAANVLLYIRDKLREEEFHDAFEEIRETINDTEDE